MGYVSRIVRTGGRVMSIVVAAYTLESASKPLCSNSVLRVAIALTGIAGHESETSGNCSMETSRAEPVEGHEAGTGCNRNSDQQKIIAATAMSATRMLLPRLFLPERMCPLGENRFKKRLPLMLWQFVAALW